MVYSRLIGSWIGELRLLAPISLTNPHPPTPSFHDLVWFLVPACFPAPSSAVLLLPAAWWRPPPPPVPPPPLWYVPSCQIFLNKAVKNLVSVWISHHRTVDGDRGRSSLRSLEKGKGTCVLGSNKREGLIQTRAIMAFFSPYFIIHGYLYLRQILSNLWLLCSLNTKHSPFT